MKDLKSSQHVSFPKPKLHCQPKTKPLIYHNTIPSNTSPPLLSSPTKLFPLFFSIRGQKSFPADFEPPINREKCTDIAAFGAILRQRTNRSLWHHRRLQRTYLRAVEKIPLSKQIFSSFAESELIMLSPKLSLSHARGPLGRDQQQLSF